MKKLAWTTVGFFILLLGACSSDDNAPAGDSSPPPPPPPQAACQATSSTGTLWQYTVNSTNLSVGRCAGVGRASLSGSTCPTATIISSTRQHVGAGLVSTAGIAAVTWNDGFTGLIFETIYIDVDASNTMNSGDIVFGSTGNIAGVCFNTATALKMITVDWDAVATSLGSYTYSGADLPYLQEPQGEFPQLQIINPRGGMGWQDL